MCLSADQTFEQQAFQVSAAVEDSEHEDRVALMTIDDAPRCYDELAILVDIERFQLGDVPPAFGHVLQPADRGMQPIKHAQRVSGIVGGNEIDNFF